MSATREWPTACVDSNCSILQLLNGEIFDFSSPSLKLCSLAVFFLVEVVYKVLYSESGLRLSEHSDIQTLCLGPCVYAYVNIKPRLSNS